MSRVAIVAVALCWAGTTLVLAELRWFRRPRLADRLRRYAPARATTASVSTARSSRWRMPRMQSAKTRRAGSRYCARTSIWREGFMSVTGEA